MARYDGQQWMATFLPFTTRGTCDGRGALLVNQPIADPSIGRPRLGTVDGPDFHLCKALPILHRAAYMQRLIFFLHFFGPDKTLRAIPR